MEYQKIISLLEKTPNQPSKFRRKNWVEINEDARGTYNTNNQIKFKTKMLKSFLCDYSDTYILVGGPITFPNRGTAANPNNTKNMIIENCAPFTDCKSETNNMQIDNAKYIDIVMPMYNLIEYSDNYSNTSGSL